MIDEIAIEERMRFGAASEGHMLSFVTGGAVRVDDYGWVGLRVPVVAGSVVQPAGSYVDEAAWGNPEVRTVVPAELADWLVLRVGGGVGVPLAEHASSRLPDRALAIANAVEGLAEPELFRPGRLPLTPFAELEARYGRWSGVARLKTPVLLRVSDGAEERETALAVVTQLEGRVMLTRRLGLGLTPQLVVDSWHGAELSIGGGPFLGLGEWGRIALDVRGGAATVGVGLRFEVKL